MEFRFYTLGCEHFRSMASVVEHVKHQPKTNNKQKEQTKKQATLTVQLYLKDVH